MGQRLRYKEQKSQIGKVESFGREDADGTRYLYCDGSSLLRANYPQLFAAIGTAYGSVDGLSFNVPDMRGISMRGKADGTGSDPDRAARTAIKPGGNVGDNIGSYQDDQFQSFFIGDATFRIMTRDSYAGAGIGGGGGGAYGSGIGGNRLNTGPFHTNTTAGTGIPRHGTETRMKNIYVKYYIRYEV